MNSEKYTLYNTELLSASGETLSTSSARADESKKKKDETGNVNRILDISSKKRYNKKVIILTKQSLGGTPGIQVSIDL